MRRDKSGLLFGIVLFILAACALFVIAARADCADMSGGYPYRIVFSGSGCERLVNGKWEPAYPDVNRTFTP